MKVKLVNHNKSECQEYFNSTTDKSRNHTIVVRPTTARACYTDINCQTIVQLCRTSDLELTATCCVKLLRLSLYFQI